MVEDKVIQKRASVNLGLDLVIQHEVLRKVQISHHFRTFET